MRNSVNILIDANNFWNRTLFSAQLTNKKDKLFAPEDKNIYIRKLSIDLAAFLRRFKGNYNSVIFCVDSTSWRKLDSELIETDYKGTRKKREEINWKVYNEANSEFIEIIKNVGINVVKAQDCEADDLIRGYVEYFKEKKENSVVWSADNDLFQLVYHNKDSFNIQYYQPPMTRNSIAGTESFFNWLNHSESDNKLSAEDMLFNLAEVTKNSYNITLNEIFKKAGLLEKVIDPLEVIFKKVIGGDGSDNITKLKPGLGKKTLEKIWSHYKNSFNVNSLLNEIYQIGMVDYTFNLTYPKKLKEGQDIILENQLNFALKNIPLNVKLILLDKRVTPDYININIDNVIQNEMFNKINTSKIEDMKKLLDGTPYYNSKEVNINVPKSMDPFSGINTKPKSLF